MLYDLSQYLQVSSTQSSHAPPRHLPAPRRRRPPPPHGEGRAPKQGLRGRPQHVRLGARRLPHGADNFEWFILKKYLFGWLVCFGEPCFQGRPILYFTNTYAITLSHCRVVSQDPSSRSRYPPPERDSIQVLPAVSFLEARTLPTELPGLGKIFIYCEFVVRVGRRLHPNPPVHGRLRGRRRGVRLHLRDGGDRRSSEHIVQIIVFI